MKRKRGKHMRGKRNQGFKKIMKFQRKSIQMLKFNGKTIYRSNKLSLKDYKETTE